MTGVDEKWMRLALEMADRAAELGEVPVGAVVVRGEEMLSAAHNLCLTNQDATAHAELLAISRACQKLGSWRLSGCTLYVTLEPCPMCAGAAVNARIDRIVYGAKDPRAGACESLIRISSYPLEARPLCESGLMEEEALSRLRSFFSTMRHK